MKKLYVFFLLLIISEPTFSQDSFIVDGNEIMTGYITKIIGYRYNFKKGKYNLVLIDSIVTLTNEEKSISLTNYCIEGFYNKNKQYNVKYFTNQQLDSISKHYSEGKLQRIYKTLYDSLNRIKYYALEDFNPDWKSDFEWTYEYKDSTSNEGRVSSQVVFVKDKYGTKRFHFRLDTLYDNNGSIIKSYRIASGGDTSIYDKTGKDITPQDSNVYNSSLSELDGHEDKIYYKEIIKDFNEIELKDFKLTLCKILKENKHILNSKKWDLVHYIYCSSDGLVKIEIRNIHNDIDRNVVIKISQKYKSN